MRRQFFVATATTISLLALVACGTGTESSGTRTRNAVGSIAPAATVLAGEVVASTTSWNRRPSSTFVYTVAGMGDSFGSGEGNPLFGNGDWADTKWFSYSNDPDDARKCHRSIDSGFYKALRRLETTYTYITFQAKNFACTGAVIGNLISRQHLPNTRQNRVDKQRFEPQIAQISRWMNSLSTGRTLDALYLSIGGNNAGFSDGIAECVLAQFDWNWGCMGANNETMADIRNRVSQLPSNYISLQNAINTSSYRPNNVVISTYPNFVKNEDGEWCETDDWPLGMVTSREWEMLWNTMGIPLNRTIREKAQTFGWRVAEMETRYENHVLCDSADDYVSDNISAWINDDQAASRRQGNDFDDGGKGFLSMGMVHPNDAGYESYADAITEQLANGLLEKATAPGTVTNLRAVKNNSIKDAAGNVQVKFNWTPPPANGRNWAARTGYKIVLTTDVDGSRSTIELGEGNTFTGFINPKYHKFQIAPCGQVLSSRGVRGCGNTTSLTLARPQNLTPLNSAFTTTTVTIPLPTTSSPIGRG